jgi:FkbM family methyltransferase
MIKYIKSLIKFVFNNIGYDVHSNKKNIQDRRVSLQEVLQQLVRIDFRPNTVIDIGVATGTFELYKAYPYAKHLLIEPLKEFEADLEKISQKYGAEYVLAAAGNRTGSIKIYVHDDLLGSSLYKEVEGKHVDGRTRKVPVVKIDDICKKKEFKGPYVIKIDTQGSELLALQGAEQILRYTEVIILETHFFQFYRGIPQFHNIVSFMNKNNFVAYDIFGGYNRPLDGALASVDMVFVKKNGFFRKIHSFARLEQRKQLADEVKRNVLNYHDE